MRKKLIIISISAIVLIILAGGIGIYKHIQSSLGSLLTVELPDINMMEIEDGVYSGSYTAIPVSAEVSVTVKDHVITDIKIIKHVNGQGAPAEIITDRIIKAQSLHVDSVTGATYNSKVILLAVKNALIGSNNQ